MAEDDYDLMPHKEILKLKKEVQELRKALTEKKVEKPAAKGTKAKKGADVVKRDDISPSIEKLSYSINNLLELFTIAGEEIKAEEHHKPHEHLSNMNMHLDKLNKNMETLIRHNEEIAKGILVVAEMMKEHLPAINDNTRTTKRAVMQQPRPRDMQRSSPPPMAPPPPRPRSAFQGPPPSFEGPNMQQPPVFPQQDIESFPQPAPKKKKFPF